MAATIDQLRAFVALAETGQFTRAADRLDLSQSSLSSTIQRLEALLGVRLFDRHTRGCRLTDAGQALLGTARRMTQEWLHLQEDARDFARFGQGRLSIAAPSVQCALLLPPLLREFQRRFPGVRVLLHDTAEQQIHEHVRTGVADLGVATRTDARTELTATAFYSDEYVLALPPGHALARRKSVDWSQLAGESVIGPMPGNPVRQHLDDTLAQKGLALGYAHEVSLPWTMVGLVREGFGVAVLTTAVRPLIEWHRLEVRPLVRPAISRTLVVLRPRGRALDAPVAAFRDLLLGLRGA
ncbi:MAG TPA: LysR family transcriptional regulator [Ramlibacter sp.]|nr:LysR family transcriptional regulator [Ramlibacter sp.]